MSEVTLHADSYTCKTHRKKHAEDLQQKMQRDASGCAHTDSLKNKQMLLGVNARITTTAGGTGSKYYTANDSLSVWH